MEYEPIVYGLDCCPHLYVRSVSGHLVCWAAQLWDAEGEKPWEDPYCKGKEWIGTGLTPEAALKDLENKMWECDDMFDLTTAGIRRKQ